MQVFKNKKGQGLLLEYALNFFLVIAFVVSMAIYVRRTVQARIHSTARYVSQEVNAVFYDPSMNFVGNFHGQYEPYYQQSQAIREKSSEVVDRVFAAGRYGIFEKNIVNETAKSDIETYQAPPACSD